ncbi:prephenate dehydratase [Dolichospermum sp. ST_sed1]|nr:prephenate dehydratase [Dolichospermum sp. ST_sed1]
MQSKKNLKVAFQGVKGAYSEEASLNYFNGKRIKLYPMHSFDDAFKAIKKGEMDFGVLPIENSLAGGIHQNYDLLLEYNLWIVGEFKHRVSHNLLCHPDADIKKIKEVYSHPQALAQCKGFLKKHKYLSTPYFDTAAAAKLILESQNKEIAAIASKVAAKEYNLRTIKSSIEDNEQNFTRFLILQKEKIEVSKKISSEESKTSILFNLKNIPGALHKVLSIFAIREIDLLKIESRPMPGNPWQYMFYLDFKGKYTDEPCRNALIHLKEVSENIKLLGSYPAHFN